MVEDRLDGWKEIAAYLGKDPRTVQRWERKIGLPIHRPNGASVFAYRSELESWLRTADQSEIEREPALAVWNRPLDHFSKSKLIVFFGIVGLSIAAIAYFNLRTPPEPVHVAVEGGDNLVVSDESGAVLWSRKVDGIKQLIYDNNLTVSNIADLNGDGIKELLLLIRPNALLKSLGRRTPATVVSKAPFLV